MDLDSIMLTQANTLRVMLDGTELERYNPATSSQDSWSSEFLDLSQYVGSSFQLCFENKSIWSAGQDPDGIGDRTFLDNISLQGIFTQVSKEQLSGIRIFPNPNTGIFHIHNESASALTGSIVDSKGSQLRVLDVKQGVIQHKIDLTSLSEGIYMVILQNQQGYFTEKIFIQSTR